MKPRMISLFSSDADAAPEIRPTVNDFWSRPACCTISTVRSSDRTIRTAEKTRSFRIEETPTSVTSHWLAL
jgi:hypothetical protein